MSISVSERYLEPGTLWTKIRHQTQHGLNCGALKPIATQHEWVEHGQIRFLVRILDNLVRKEKAQVKQRQTGGKPFNPFLPYEEDLFVTYISDTHLCLLNKFNVVDHHSLIVTREFEAQENWLNYGDFEALWACLVEIDGLAFYNGGKSAGASQRHKHLQLVPLPMVPGDNEQPLPIETAIAAAQFTADIGIAESLPFRHGIMPLSIQPENSLAVRATQTLATYHRLLDAMGLPLKGDIQTGPYNLLMTQRWMMLIPRSQEDYQSIPINALGFAGSFLVKNADQMAQLKQIKPLNLLRGVGLPR